MMMKHAILCVLLLEVLLYQVTAKFSTSFENKDWSGIKQDDKDNFDWSIHKGKTRTSRTGPSKASAGEYYIYIESSKPTKRGDEARIYLPSVQSEGKYCLAFMYSMYGSKQSMGTLSVHHNGKQIWSRAGPQGKDWHAGKLTLSLKSSDRISFLAKKTGIRSDIALDDISLGLCSGGQKVGNKIASKSNNNYKFSCDFEGGEMCSIYQNDDALDWIMKTEPAKSGANGPQNGAHSGKGYISLEDPEFKLKPGSYGMVSTPRVQTKDKYCLTFWYYMNGKAGKESTLKVFKNRISPDYRPGTELWSQQAAQGNAWHKVAIKVDLDSWGRVGFEGTLGSAGQGDVSLDDVSLIPCA